MYLLEESMFFEKVTEEVVMPRIWISSRLLQSEIMTSRPWTPTAVMLRISNGYPELQPAFLKLVNVINDVPSPSVFFHEALHEIWETLPRHLQVIFILAEYCVPNCIYDCILRYAINEMIIPYFLVTDEKSYEEAQKRFSQDGAGIILDIVGEEAHTPEDAETYLSCYKHVIETTNAKVAVKPSSLIPASVFETNTHEENKTLLKKKFAELFIAAETTGAAITIDAEEYFKWCLLTEEAFFETILEPRFSDPKYEVGIALQTYRKDVMSSARKILEVAKLRGSPIRVRVVKGAYWNAEFAIAKELGKEYPLFENKEESDEMFDVVVAFFMSHREHIHVSPATHNAKNIAYALTCSLGNYSNFEFEVLVGMGEAIRRVLCERGIPVSVYCPLVRKGGKIKEGMRYLTRRLEESSAANSCLLENM